jgi:hypothetical protein
VALLRHYGGEAGRSPSAAAFKRTSADLATLSSGRSQGFAMNIEPNILVVAASLAMVVTLGLAWSLAGVRYLSSGFLKRLFPSYAYLLKAHIDYLLMTGLLMVFFLLFAHFQVSPAPVVIVAMCIGSLGNPAGFLALAIKPDLPQRPNSIFGAIMTASFVLTTVGYLGAAWYVARAALLPR